MLNSRASNGINFKLHIENDPVATEQGKRGLKIFFMPTGPYLLAFKSLGKCCREFKYFAISAAAFPGGQCPISYHSSLSFCF